MEGVDYALVISTNAGLWRYMIGDLVRFINVSEREIKITGRIKQFLSLAGEHLSLDNINSAIDKVAKDLSCTISEFCIVADQEKMYQQWYFGTLDKVNPEELMKAIDKELSRINDDYASVRKYTLKDPVGSVLSVQVFYDFMDTIGKAGSQNKFARVMNPKQAEKWISFLSRMSML
jgi:hypothetical protein